MYVKLSDKVDWFLKIRHHCNLKCVRYLNTVSIFIMQEGRLDSVIEMFYNDDNAAS